jgi:hypothetical protein
MGLFLSKAKNKENVPQLIFPEEITYHYSPINSSYSENDFSEQNQSNKKK